MKNVYYKSLRMGTAMTAVTLLSLLGAGQVRALFLSDDSHLTLPSTGPRRPDRVQILNISDGADFETFSSPHAFPRLQGVGLASSHSNGIYLSRLADNYPALSGLSITQEGCLDDHSVSYLRNFSRLRVLSIACPVSNAGLLFPSLPESLRVLTLRLFNNTPNQNLRTKVELPYIEKLVLIGYSLDQSFLNQLDAPRLRVLSLEHVRTPEGGFMNLANFPRLKVVDLLHTTVSASQIEPLKLQHIRIHIDND